MLEKFRKDKRGVNYVIVAVGAFIGAVIIVIAGVNMAPIVAYEVDNVIFQNATNWNFTANSGAAALMGLIPFVFIAGILLAAVGMVFAWAKRSD